MITMVASAIAIIAIVAVLAMTSRAGDKTPAVGSTAPDFTLNSQEGQPVSLHDFKGKWVVLYFYPKDMTTGCTIEAHNFQRDLAKYEAKNAVILGVSVQDEKSHQAVLHQGESDVQAAGGHEERCVGKVRFDYESGGDEAFGAAHIFD